MFTMLQRSRTLVYLLCLLVADVAANNEEPCKCGSSEKPLQTMAAIVETYSTNSTIGVAAIISAQHALTSRRELSRTSHVQIRVRGPQTEKTSVYEVARVICEKTDIAMLVTKDKMAFNDFVLPACLPNKKTPPGEKVIAVGWDVNLKEIRTCSNFKTFNLTIQNIYGCDTWYNIYWGKLLCTKEGGALMYAFGAPVFWKDPVKNRYIVIGLANYNRNPKDYPAVHSDVFAYTDWIKEKLEKMKSEEKICT